MTHIISSMSADWTNGLLGAQTDHTLLDTQRDRISIMRFIPKSLHANIRARTSTTDVTTYINNGIQSGEQLWVPKGLYNISGVKLIGETDIQGARAAQFAPVTAGASMFYTENANFSNAKHAWIVVEGIRIINPNHINNVIAFDLPEVRHGSMFQRIHIDGGNPSDRLIGMYFRRLNWNTKLISIEARNCGTGFQFDEAAACLDILQCNSLNNDIGWFLNGVDTTDPVTGTVFGITSGIPITLMSIRQGVCQFNNVGVRTRNTYTTRLEKMHFENNGIDIDMDGDRYLLAEDCEFSGNNNLIASNGGITSRPGADTTSAPIMTKSIKARNTIACEIRNPTYYGTRQLGFWDIPSSGNSGTIASRIKCITSGTTLINSGLGDTSVLAPAWTISTSYSLGNLVSANGNLYYNIGAGTSAGTGIGPSGTGSSISDGGAIWTYAAVLPTVNRKLGDVSGLLYDMERGYVQNLSGTAIDLDVPISTYLKTVPSGGANISLSNKNHDGRRVVIILRGASSITDGSIVKVDNKTVVTLNAVDALKNNIVYVENNASAAGGPAIMVGVTHGSGVND